MLEYNRFSDDLFMLVLRPDAPKSRLAEHPDVQEVARAVSELRIHGEPRHSSPVRPRHYAGVFAWETEKFRVASIYAFRGFFALTCKPLSGSHSAARIGNLVEVINNGLPAG